MSPEILRIQRMSSLFVDSIWNFGEHLISSLKQSWKKVVSNICGPKRRSLKGQPEKLLPVLPNLQSLCEAPPNHSQIEVVGEADVVAGSTVRLAFDPARLHLIGEAQ